MKYEILYRWKCECNNNVHRLSFGVCNSTTEYNIADIECIFCNKKIIHVETVRRELDQGIILRDIETFSVIAEIKEKIK